MRFNWGAIPESKDFIPDEKWKSLREPSDLWLAQLCALPVAFVAFAGFAVLWSKLAETRLVDPAAFLLSVAAIVPQTIAHELIHTLVHPSAGRSDRSILGFWP